jgi:hypothetical protein
VVEEDEQWRMWVVLLHGGQQSRDSGVAGELVVEARRRDEIGVAAQAPCRLEDVGHRVPAQDVLAACARPDRPARR